MKLIMIIEYIFLSVVGISAIIGMIVLIQSCLFIHPSPPVVNAQEYPDAKATSRAWIHGNPTPTPVKHFPWACTIGVCPNDVR